MCRFQDIKLDTNVLIPLPENKLCEYIYVIYIQGYFKNL